VRLLCAGWGPFEGNWGGGGRLAFPTVWLRVSQCTGPVGMLWVQDQFLKARDDGDGDVSEGGERGEKSGGSEGGSATR
jgi:hypothetical protein